MSLHASGSVWSGRSGHSTTRLAGHVNTVHKNLPANLQWRTWCTCPGGRRFGALSACYLPLPLIRRNVQFTEKTPLGCHYEGCSGDVGQQTGNVAIKLFQVAAFLQICPAKTFSTMYLLVFLFCHASRLFSSLPSLPLQLLLSIPSHPYQTTGKITVSSVSILHCL